MRADISEAAEERFSCEMAAERMGVVIVRLAMIALDTAVSFPCATATR